VPKLPKVTKQAKADKQTTSAPVSVESSAIGLKSRITALQGVLRRLSLFADLSGSMASTGNNSTGAGTTASNGQAGNSSGVDLLHCNSFRDLIQTWRKAMKWTEGLDTALSVMLAAVTSTKAIGDQLWIKVLGPPSCGKSSLCEALSTAKDYVIAKSTMRGFHSGYGEGEEDHGLISQVSGKTLVVKDGDTLLQAPNLGQILSEARDIYDTVSRSSYRKKGVSRDYAGIRMTWILCGTSGLRKLDNGELGARFLDCVIMEGIDDELEDEILWRVVNKAARNLVIEADGRPDTHQDPEMTQAMQMTGGYVCYLRENATELLSSVMFTDEVKHTIKWLGKFVAYMRARPSRLQDEVSEREFAARLVSQLMRLATCLAVVLNRREIDEEVLRRTKKVALDTARGRTLDIVRTLYANPDGCGRESITHETGVLDARLKTLLMFLKHLGAVESFQIKKAGVTQKPKWRLSILMRKLYGEVCSGLHNTEADTDDTDYDHSNPARDLI
jgi:hypothetical protein